MNRRVDKKKTKQKTEYLKRKQLCSNTTSVHNFDNARQTVISKFRP